MKRWAIGLCALIVATAALALATGAAAGTTDHQLLSTYQPVLVFHPDESFRPVKVQSFVDDTVLERFVGNSPAQLPLDAFWTVVDADPEPGELPPPTPGVFYRLNQSGCTAWAPLAGRECYAAAASIGSGGPAVYGRVARTENRIVLQYWLFYYDNPLILPLTPFGAFWQSHEADWELGNVVLDNDEQPLEAAYSQHCSGQRLAWAGVEKRPIGSTHPVAYVALGSHANYFAPGAGAPGEIPIKSACVPDAVRPILPAIPFLHVTDQVVDGSAAGDVVGPPGSGLPQATIHQIDGTAWSEFGGRWGESEYFFTPIALARARARRNRRPGRARAGKPGEPAKLEPGDRARVADRMTAYQGREDSGRSSADPCWLGGARWCSPPARRAAVESARCLATRRTSVAAPDVIHHMLAACSTRVRSPLREAR